MILLYECARCGNAAPDAEPVESGGTTTYICPDCSKPDQWKVAD